MYKHIPVETTEAILPSAGLVKTATLHRYDHSARITIQPRGKNAERVTGLAHFYKCTVTGEVRRWGFDRVGGTSDDVGN